MDGQFSDRLKTVLSDPDAMETIAKLARNFAKKNPSAQKEASESPSQTLPGPPRESGGLGELFQQPAIASALKFLQDGSRERVALLQAIHYWKE